MGCYQSAMDLPGKMILLLLLFVVGIGNGLGTKLLSEPGGCQDADAA